MTTIAECMQFQFGVGQSQLEVVFQHVLCPQFTATKCSLARPLEFSRLSARARNKLMRLGARTLADVAQFSAVDLLSSKQFGETTLREVEKMLAEYGAKLKASTNDE